MGVYNPPPAGGGGGSVTIAELDADPGSPTAEEAWVLRVSNGGFGTPGKLYAFMGLGFPYVGSTPSGYSYQFSYQTAEGPIVRAPLS